MLIKKISEGCVVQTYDTVLGKWVSQEFISRNNVTYEPLEYEPPDPEPYLPFDMVQPE